jgi:hypothetical protein
MVSMHWKTRPFFLRLPRRGPRRPGPNRRAVGLVKRSAALSRAANLGAVNSPWKTDDLCAAIQTDTAESLACVIRQLADRLRHHHREIPDAVISTVETDLAAAICDLLHSFGRLIATRPAPGSRFDADRFEDLGQFHNQSAQLCRQLDRLTGQR